MIMRDVFLLGQKYISVYKQLNLFIPLQNVICKIFKIQIEDTKCMKFIIAFKWHGFQTAHII